MKKNELDKIDLVSFDLYNLSEEEEKVLWKDCLFVFDSSALLDFYSLTGSTVKTIFEEVFEAKIMNRLWISDHIQYEYFNNRENVIDKILEENYTPLNKSIIIPLAKSISESKSKLNELKQRIKKDDSHPYFAIDIESIEEVLETYSREFSRFKDEFNMRIQNVQREMEDLKLKDTILEGFTKFFIKGRKYDFEEIFKICQEGEVRYRMEVPPGYLDEKDKVGTQKFGDFIIWKQILEQASNEGKGVVLIINDIKPDWCIADVKQPKKRIQNPRHELLKEFNDATGKRFWMYTLDTFMYKSKELLNANVSELEIAEISEITFKDAAYYVDKGHRKGVKLLENTPVNLVFSEPFETFTSAIHITYKPKVDPFLIVCTFTTTENKKIISHAFISDIGYTIVENIDFPGNYIKEIEFLSPKPIELDVFVEEIKVAFTSDEMLVKNRIESLGSNHAGTMLMKNGVTANYGSIRIMGDYFIHYTAKGLRQIWAPNADKSFSSILQAQSEGELIESGHIAMTRLSDINSIN